MRRWNVTFAVVLAAGLATTPLVAQADHHEKAGTAEEKGAPVEGSGGHAHDGAKAEGEADMKKAGAAEEGSSAGHGHAAQGEKKEEGSH